MNVPDTMRAIARSLEYGGGATMEFLVKAHAQYMPIEDRRHMREILGRVSWEARETGNGRIPVLRKVADELDAAESVEAWCLDNKAERKARNAERVGKLLAERGITPSGGDKPVEA